MSAFRQLTPWGLSALRHHVRAHGTLPDTLEPDWAEGLPTSRASLTEAEFLVADLSTAGPTDDATHAILLHRALPLERRLAANRHFWPWLAAFPLRHYTLTRWADQKRLPADRIGPAFHLNALSRLWWAVEATRVDNAEELLRALGLMAGEGAGGAGDGGAAGQGQGGAGAARGSAGTVRGRVTSASNQSGPPSESDRPASEEDNPANAPVGTVSPIRGSTTGGRPAAAPPAGQAFAVSLDTPIDAYTFTRLAFRSQAALTAVQQRTLSLSRAAHIAFAVVVATEDLSVEAIHSAIKTFNLALSTILVESFDVPFDPAQPYRVDPEGVRQLVALLRDLLAEVAG